MIFLAGACPLADDGSTVGPGDIAAQAARCAHNLRIALADAGASVPDLISTRVLVATTSRAELVTAWNVVRDVWPRTITRAPCPG
ncbi:hypothetical protein KIH74_03635 [Kineosporia sp. J2-2]|uniref:Uncharacterized protein n=1 Tax=Kineosporia corallincola TaxID=2835133 RepID=A0ABS5TAB2_9ACTN|nr:Rid family hydrolase [Kineosporia corallincola]MBT0768000.1 hypothetical protein [Kineosporia corallincola]